LAEVSTVSAEEGPVLVDAVLEYIDYFERLAGSNEAKTFGELRKALLLKRTQMPILPVQTYEIPQDERPDIGHDSSRIAAELGVMGKDELFSVYHWRPALHDKMSIDRGFGAGLGIDFFDLNIRHRWRDKKLEVKEFYPLRITSLPSLEPIVRRPAWNFSVGTNLEDSCRYDGLEVRDDSSNACRRYFMQAGIGQTVPFKKWGLLGYSMLSLALGHNDQLSGGVYMEPNLESGMNWKPTQGTKFNLMVLNQASKGRHGGFKVTHSLSSKLMHEFAKNHEVRLSVLGQVTKYREMSGGYYWYF
jgi:hypothetical protein